MSLSPPLVNYHLLDTGYCVVAECDVLRGASRQKVECHALVALIEHPTAGWLLWDTGYAPHMLAATSRWPYRLYRLATPLHMRPELAVAAQLGRFGLKPGDIGRVIVSHFHADHIAGLRDFPEAALVAHARAYADVAQRSGLRALQRGFIPELLPPDFARRAELLPSFSGPPLPALGPTHDLLGDGSLLLVELPGHARGQIGMLAHTERGRVLFAADGAWFSRSYREVRLPGRVTYAIVDDPAAVKTTLERLRDFSLACPDVLIVPTHCPEIYQSRVMGDG
jgi:glyoxylase-like metal-dependent hydrolase (beta-lactamase superfamily II)